MAAVWGEICRYLIYDVDCLLIVLFKKFAVYKMNVQFATQMAVLQDYNGTYL